MEKKPFCEFCKDFGCIYCDPKKQSNSVGGQQFMKIGDVIMVCKKCGWVGKLYDAEPNVDGDGNLGCPEQCVDNNNDFIIVKEVTNQSYKMN